MTRCLFFQLGPCHVLPYHTCGKKILGIGTLYFYISRYVDFGSSVDPILKGFITRSGYRKVRQYDNDGTWTLDANGVPTILHHYLQSDTYYGRRIWRSDKDTFS
jgi:hypothetical protein